MYYSIGLLAVVGFIALLLAVWVLARTRWVVGFLAGMLGLGTLTIALLFVLSAMRLFQYEPVDESALLGTLTVTARSSSNYQVSLAHNRSMRRYEVAGDRWRVQGTRLSIPTFLVLGEPQSYFMVNKLQGRFSSLEDELGAERAELEAAWYERLADAALKQAFRSETLYKPLLPLANEAIFTLEYQAGVLRLRGVNEPASEALSPRGASE